MNWAYGVAGALRLVTFVTKYLILELWFVKPLTSIFLSQMLVSRAVLSNFERLTVGTKKTVVSG